MPKQNQTLTVKPALPMQRNPTPTVKARVMKLHRKVLVKVGLRSRCCEARILAWHHDKFYCEKCRTRQ